MRGNREVVCGFTLNAGKLKWESNNEWIDIDSTGSVVVSVHFDWEAKDLSVPRELTWGSHSYYPFQEKSEQIAKKWCIDNGYELEKIVFNIPYVRWLVKKT